MAASAATATSSPGLCPNYAVICSFLERYGALLDLPELTFPQLERYLQDTSTVPKLLVDLHVKLLRKIGKSVTADRWEKYLVKVCQEFNMTWAWELEEKGYKEMPMESKTGILKFLCESQFDENVKFKTAINDEDPDKMRLQPIGRDKDGQMYWYQQDQDNNVRLYIEEQDDLDGASWKCIRTHGKTVLFRRVGKRMSKLVPLNLVSCSADDARKTEDTSDEEHEDSKKGVCPISSKSKSDEEEAAQKDELKPEGAEVKSSLNGVAESKAEAEVSSENVSMEAQTIKQESVDAWDVKSNSTETPPTYETTSVKTEKAEELKKSSSEEIQQALKNEAKIPLKKRGMKFSEDLERNGSIGVQTPTVCNQKEVSKEVSPEPPEKFQRLSDHLNGEVEPSLHKAADGEEMGNKEAANENVPPAAEEDGAKSRKVEASTAEAEQEVASHQEDTRTTHSVQEETKAENREGPESPLAPLGETRLCKETNSPGNDINQEPKTDQSCENRTPSLKKTSETESNDLKLSHGVTSKETESKIPQENVETEPESEPPQSQTEKDTKGTQRAQAGEETSAEQKRPEGNDESDKTEGKTDKSEPSESSDGITDTPGAERSRTSEMKETPEEKEKPSGTAEATKAPGEGDASRKELSPDRVTESDGLQKKEEPEEEERRKTPTKEECEVQTRSKVAETESLDDKSSKEPPTVEQRGEVANGEEAPPPRKRKPAHRRKAELQREQRLADSESDSNTGMCLRRSPRISRPTSKAVEIQDKKSEKVPVCAAQKDDKEKEEEEGEEEEEEEVKTVERKPKEKRAEQEGHVSQSLFQILLCDSCDSGYHTACLRPPLMIIPDGEWFCPPCQHKQLCDKLEEQLLNLDAALKKKERAERRKERLIYVGISLENIITPSVEEEKPEIVIKEKKEKRSKGWGRRSTRAKKTISYRFDEFDEAIEEAIEEDIKEAEGGGAGRGKDMANITGHRGKDISTILQAEEGKENGRPPRPSAGQRRKKRRRLNDLDSDSTVDEEESEDEFCLSESSEEEFVVSENESEAETDPGSNNSDFGSNSSRRLHSSSRSRKLEPQRRSSRKRRRPRGYSDDEEEETDEEEEDEIGFNFKSSEKCWRYSGLEKAESSDEDSRQRRRRLALKRRRASEDDDSDSDSDDSSEEDRPVRKRVNRIDSDDDEEEEEVKPAERKAAEEASKGTEDCSSELQPANGQSKGRSHDGVIRRPSPATPGLAQPDPPKTTGSTAAAAAAPNGPANADLASQEDDEDDLLGVTDLVDYVCNNEDL
uniref:Remodeling and spacing factor 1b, tandem duplicate 1 n=1 Tax=Oryzias latipes TaxID=8090 RepID=A0A3P9M116_ORYLA